MDKRNTPIYGHLVAMVNRFTNMATDLDEGRISLGLQDLRIFANSYPTQTLDLSRRELTQVPQDLPDCKDLEVSDCIIEVFPIQWDHSVV